MSITGCQHGGEEQETPPEQETIAVLTVSLNQSSLNLEVGAEAQLVATVKPDNATDKTVTWASLDASVASVAAGKVKALKVGSTTITAKAGDITARCSVTVKAKEVQKFTVSFDSNGGSGSMASVQVNSGSEYTLPQCGFTAPSGKEFKAWEVAGAEKAVGAKITVTANVTVKALWKDAQGGGGGEEQPTTYTVTFNSNGGSAVAAQTINEGQKASKPADPTKEGYTFGGWYSDEALTTAFDFNSAINANVTLYAKWTENGGGQGGGGEEDPEKFTITFNANGGSGTMNPVEMEAGEYILPECTFTAPEGKQFKAWLVGEEEKAVGAKINVTADVTIKAVWADTPVQDFVLFVGVNDSWTPTTLQVALNDDQSVKEYYVKDVTLNKGDLFKLHLEGEDWRGYGDLKLSEETAANFKQGDVDDNIETVRETGKYDIYVAPTPDNPEQYPGKTIWVQRVKAVKGLSATYEGGVVTVGNALDLAKMSVNLVYDDDSLDQENVAESAKYYSDEACEEEDEVPQNFIFPEQLAGMDIVVYVVYNNLKAHFNLHVNAAPVQYTNYVQYSLGETWNVAELIVNPGNADELYVEGGVALSAGDKFVLCIDGVWKHFGDLEDDSVKAKFNTDDDGNIIVKNDAAGTYEIYYKITAGKIYAGLPVVKHTVSFNHGEGTGSMDPVEAPEGEYTLPECTFTAPAGKVFDGWMVAAEKKAAGETIDLVANIELIAQWKTNPIYDSDYSVIGEYGGHNWNHDENMVIEGDIASVALSLAVNDKFKIRVDHAWDKNYGFDAIVSSPDGAFEDADGNDHNIKVLTADDYVIALDIVQGKITIAKAPRYTVSFVPNGGTGSMASIENVRGSYTLPACTFTQPANKQFKCWRVGGIDKAVGDQISVYADTEVTAVWEDVYTITFNKNGGSGSMDDEHMTAGKYNLPANGFTAPDGKQFKCWEVNEVEYQPTDEITVSANVTVKAIWEDIPVVTYTVTYTANGGTGANVVDNDIAGSYQLRANPFTAPAGKQFKCWSIGGAEHAAGSYVTISDDTTVEAVWENIYTVSFDKNGGTGSMANEYMVACDYELPACGFTAPDGKVFKCWSVEDVEYAVGAEIEISKNTTIVAIWQNKVYAGKINGTDDIVFVDDSEHKPDGAVAQYKATIDVATNDVLTFTYGNEAIAPGASGENNNLAAAGLTVKDGGKALSLYLKVFDNAGTPGYDLWLDAPVFKLNRSASGLIILEKHNDQWKSLAASFEKDETFTFLDKNNEVAKRGPEGWSFGGAAADAENWKEYLSYNESTGVYTVVKSFRADLYVKASQVYFGLLPEDGPAQTFTVTSLPNWLTNDGAVIYACYQKASDGSWVWVEVDIDETTGTFSAPNNISKFLMVRCIAGTTEPNWSESGDVAGRIYNKINDVTCIAATYSYASPEWVSYNP